ncbi:hypothetical protein EH30_11400 [Erythrobacter sp. JL475]|jgi:hypothetical protein|nr:hypothetical protein EH30_11400 [Erythrobacter sp. JL475]
MDGVTTQQPGTGRRSLARKLIIDLSVMTVIGVVMALIGPFGSFGDPLAVRLMVWLGLGYAGYFIYSPVGWLVDRLSAALDLPRILLWVAGTMLATVPMAVIVWSLGQITTDYFRVPQAQEALLHYCYVLVIGGGITLLFNMIQIPGDQPQPTAVAQADTTTKEAPSAAAQPAANLLLDQLPASLGSDVIALEMEDHYVRVHTALGSELVLMRLRDAMAYLSDVEGRQVHRSWWVARLAVEDVKREGRNVRLVLSGGLEAPVARAQVSELKTAGWI